MIANHGTLIVQQQEMKKLMSGTNRSAGLQQLQLLTDAAELYLFESVSLLSAAIYHSSPEETISQFNFLKTITDFQIEQLRQLFVVINNSNSYFEELAPRVTHIVHSLTLLTKGFFLSKHGDFQPIFEMSAAVILSMHRELFKSGIIRNKVIMFLHRLILCLESAKVIAIVNQICELLLVFCERSDFDLPIGLLCQLMIEYKDSALILLQSHFVTILSKYEQLLVTGSVGMASNGGGGVVMEPSHVKSERVNTKKSYLSFLCHVCSENCEALLLQSNNLAITKGVVITVMHCITHSDAMVISNSDSVIYVELSKADKIALAKQGVLCVHGLMKALMPAIESSKTDAASGNSGKYSQSDSGRIELLSLIFNEIVPTMFKICANGLLNVRDAYTQSLLAEIGGVVWLVASTAYYNSQSNIAGVTTCEDNNFPHTTFPNCLSYFSMVMQSLEWPENVVSQMISCIQAVVNPNSGAAIPLGAFKEQFKALWRQL